VDFTKLKIGDSYGQDERSLIRRIRADDVEEMKRLRIIDSDPAVAEFVEGLLTTDEELKNFAIGGEDRLTVGVVGKRGHVDEVEVDKIQGWIYFSPDDKERLDRLKETGLLGRSFDGVSVTEVSYAKYPGAKSGQMSSGLRQVIKILKRKCATLNEHLIVTAYTDEANVNSSRLLSAAGFQRIGNIDYHVGAEKSDEVWILRLF
jgi:hypothetical protein